MDRAKLPQMFERFDLEISHHRGSAYRVRLGDSPDGRRSAIEVDFGWLPFGEDDDSSNDSSVPYLGTLRHIRSFEGAEDPRQLGERLFRTVFSRDVGAAFRASVRAVRSRRGEGLRVRLAFDDAPRLAGLPWEALWDPTEGAFLSDQPYLVVVRTLCIAEPIPQFLPPEDTSVPLGLLALLPAPQGEDALSGAEEWRRIRESLGGLIGRGQLEASQVEPPTLPALQHRLESRPCDVLHVVAHGQPGAPGDGGVLCLENAEGASDAVFGNVLLRALAGAEPPRLVVLNLCYGATSSDVDPFDGLAQTLLRRGVAAVVAMRDSISDAAAVLFATTFYRHLAGGRTVEAAMVASRRALGTSEQRDELISPVLYMLQDNVVLTQATRSQEHPPWQLARARRVVPLALFVMVAILAAWAWPYWQPEAGHDALAEPGRDRATEEVAEAKVPASLELSTECPAPPGFRDLEFVVIEPGVATIGGEPWTVEERFCISIKEISRRDWRTALEEDLPQKEWPGNWPITHVGFDDALRFAARLEELHLGANFRLPTASEWRLAAAAGATTPYYFGETDDELHRHGNCSNFLQQDCFDGPAPVGSFEPNDFGLYDVHGNVAEWVDAIDPTGEGRRLRLGGSYRKVRDCRLDKDSWVQAEGEDDTGFRIVREISPRPAD